MELHTLYNSGYKYVDGILTTANKIKKVMALYSADLFDNATPVSKPKTPRKKAAAKIAPVKEEEEVAAPVKPKRVMSEAQKAALAKGQETRKRKREEAAAAEAALVATAEANHAAAEAKKAKRKQARLAKKEGKQEDTPASSSASSDGIDGAIDEAVTEVTKLPPKKRRMKTVPPPSAPVKDLDPPAWFKQYVSSVKNEENRMAVEKKPKKVVKEESAAVASAKWNDGVIRARVRGELDRHFDNTYSMIFGRARTR